MLKLRTTITALKNSQDGLNSRLNQERACICVDQVRGAKGKVNSAYRA
jgi:hypothetical protein